MTNAQLHGCPLEGWVCFFCGEVFTTIGGARDHFGAAKDQKPGCLIRVQYGNERGLEMELRKAQDEIADLRKQLAAAEFHLSASY